MKNQWVTWTALDGGGPKRALRRQRSHVRIVSGAPTLFTKCKLPCSGRSPEAPSVCFDGDVHVWIGRSAASRACRRAMPSASVLSNGSSHSVTSAAPSSRVSTCVSGGYFACAARSGGR